MTAKDYRLIARVIADLPETERPLVAQRFATALLGTNPRFDIVRFVAAAMGNPITKRDA